MAKYFLTLSVCFIITISGVISISHYGINSSKDLEINMPIEEDENIYTHYVKSNKSITSFFYSVYNTLFLNTLNSNLFNDFLYYNGHFYFSSLFKFKNQLLGKNLKTEKQLNQILKEHNNNIKHALNNGSKYFCFVFPESQTIQKSKLPYYIKSAIRDTSAKNQILTFLKKRNNRIKIHDMTDMLHEYADSTLLYIPNDTHWNDYAAYLVYNEMINIMSPALPPLKLDKVEMNEVLWLKEYSEIEVMSERLKDEFHFPFYDRPVYHMNGLSKSLKFKNHIVDSLPVITTRHGNQSHLDSIKKNLIIRYAKYSTSAKSKLTAVVFCDSYSEPLMKYLSPHFDTVEYFYGMYTAKKVEEVNPDIVIVAHVERMFTKF